MLLFIDRLPLFTWPMQPASEGVAITLPIVPQNRGVLLPSRAALERPFRWKWDTACVRDGFAYRSQFLAAGLNPRAGYFGETTISTVLGNRQTCFFRATDLWLVSNIPALRPTPVRMTAFPGIVVHQSLQPAPELRFPLIGPSLLRRAGLCVLTDFAAGTVSVWVPAPWPRSVAHTICRFFSFPRTAPIRWANEPGR